MVVQVTPASDSDTRSRILEAARRLFHEQGFTATGVSTILREADANAGSLYHFFPSKEALLAGVLEHYTTLLRPVVIEPVERAEEDPVERVFALLAFYRAELERTGCRMGCPIGNLALEVSDQYPAVRDRVRRNFDGWTEAVARWLEDATDRLPRGSDPQSVARFVLCVMEGAVMQARAAGSLEPFDDAVRELRRHFTARAPAPRRGRRGSR